MINITSPIYDKAKSEARDFYDKTESWDKVLKAFDFLKEMSILEDYITKDEWTSVVKDMKENYELPSKIEKITASTTIISAGTDNGTTIPDEPESAWVLYKEELQKSGWSQTSIENLEENTYSILKKLHLQTNEPVKGLVIGKVQSGKTASMAGLMAMAADWGWNTFIILSGMIDNLRKQTQERLIKDLMPKDGRGLFSWRGLDKLSKNMEIVHRTQSLDFSARSRDKYINVVLKNTVRLENLIGWMKEDKGKLQQMKVLVIDDEADQASVNTKKLEEQERAKINDLIIQLVEVGRDEGNSPNSMNYISYTATPYANFLNEYGDTTLYPKDFVGMLSTAEEYFGPKEIFGYGETDGLDITRTISDRDLGITKDVQDGYFNAMPNALKDSLCWFLISTSIRRFHNIIKPTSMLVHTSQLQDHHKNVAEGISNWLTNTPNKIILDKCEDLFEREIHRFSIEEFKNNFKDYPEDYSINDYPEFSDIKYKILQLIEDNISHIKMDEEGSLNYKDGIHLCIDNCAHNEIDDESQHIRLAYPTQKQLEKINQSPAFIIVGGSTLSRGLTIEGLVSTYFLRGATAADSLMQMGRWFGYRRGYELLPRIWMTEDTVDKFEFLTELEEELREELQQFSADLKTPSEYGPRVKNTPSVSWLRVTAANKMQDAMEIDMDFSGASIQTIHFENNVGDLEHNINRTTNFLENYCGSPKESQSTNSVVFKNVDFGSIRDQFLRGIKFHPRSRTFNNIEAFISWFEKVMVEEGFSNWNVIVPSSGEVSQGEVAYDNQWSLGSFVLNKVQRSAKTINKDFVNIGVLRGPSDLYADIDNLARKDKKSSNPSNLNIREIRSNYGMEDTPQLIIYRIDKNSKARTENTKRKDLNFDEDIIGVYINVPGSSTSKPNAKALKLNVSYAGETDE